MVSESVGGAVRGVEETFIARWGEMAAAWGINRTTAEVQALLYISGQVLGADEIMNRLVMSRGAVSMALKALMEWGIVRKVRRRGDRRDYYESLSDVWEIFTRVIALRKKKEIDPVLDSLRDTLRQTATNTSAGTSSRNGILEGAGAPSAPTTDERPKELTEPGSAPEQRLRQMVEFLVLMDRLHRRLTEMDGGLAQAIRLLADLE